MKKLLLCGIISAVISITIPFQTIKNVKAEEAGAGIPLNCKSAYCTDENGSTKVYAYHETEHFPIASMCKIMTLILTFEAIEQEKLSYDTPIPVSQYAMSMGGSQVYLQAGNEYSAEALIESVIVCSANDSCVALAEYISGNDSAFVEQMNERASSLGCKDTLFANCTGLPKDPQYSCAKDVALMFKELITHDKFFEYSQIHTDNFKHPDGRETLITNTNKMVRGYNGCDGGKTGFTNQAGFCLAATAKRNDTRVISVCIGAANKEDRAKAISGMFDYAFANYETKTIAESDSPLAEKYRLKGAKKDCVEVMPERTVTVFLEKGKNIPLSKEIKFYDQKSSVKQGEKIGEMIIFKEGVEYSRVALVSKESVAEATYLDNIRKTAQNW